MGKQEGPNNTEKAKVHSVYARDKLDTKPLRPLQYIVVVGWFVLCFCFVEVQGNKTCLIILCNPRLAWWVHKNVLQYPEDHIKKPFCEQAGYEVQASMISPQRFGKPMSRQRHVGVENNCFQSAES